MTARTPKRGCARVAVTIELPVLRALRDRGANDGASRLDAVARRVAVWGLRAQLVEPLRASCDGDDGRVANVLCLDDEAARALGLDVSRRPARRAP